MKACPVCGSKKVSETKEGFGCRKCGFLNKKFSEEYVTDVDDKKQEKRYKVGGSRRCQ